MNTRLLGFAPLLHGRAPLPPPGWPPPLLAVEGPVPDVERVVKVILAADLTPDGIINHEIAAARERRRQRRLAETGGAPGGGPPQGGSYAAGAAPGGIAGQKRKALAEYDSGSESDYDEPHAAAPVQQQQQHDGAGGAPDVGGGLDIYRMRRKQQRA